MPRSTMKVALIRHTLSPEEVVALGARLCYSRATVDSLQQRVSRDDQSEFVSRILSMGHESVLEHASFTFAMEGVSRVLLAQITRHRLPQLLGAEPALRQLREGLWLHRSAENRGAG